MDLSILSNDIGLVGVIITLVAYLLLQNKWLHPTDISFSAMNAIGASMILISLCYNWNLASAIIEFAWMLISCLGIYKSMASRS